MKKFKIVFLLFLTAAVTGFAVGGTAFAIPEAYGFGVFSPNIGARSLAEGGGASFIKDEFNPEISNPAGIFSAEGTAFSFRDSKNFSVFQIFGIEAGTAALGFVSKSDQQVPVAGGLHSLTGNYAVFSYARQIPFVTLGASVKYLLYEEYINGVTTLTGSGWDADLGITSSPTNWLDIGFCARNFLPKDFLGGGSNIWNTGSSEGITASFRSGAAVKMPFWNSALGLEIESSMDRSIPGLLHAGYEIRPLSDYTFRIGMDQQMRGNAVESIVTAGIGIRFDRLNIDAAYAPGIGEKNFAASVFYSQKRRPGDELPRPPKGSLRVMYPPDNFSTDEAMIKISGEARGLGVKINGLSVNVDRYDRFFAVVPLYMGKNLIEISGVFNGERTENQTRRVLRKAKVMLKPDTRQEIKEKVQVLATIGVIETKEDQVYKAEEEVTRAEFAMWLVKARGLSVPKLTKPPSADVKLTAPEAPYIAAVIAKGLMTPSKEGKFYPLGGVSKSEADRILKKFDELKE